MKHHIEIDNNNVYFTCNTFRLKTSPRLMLSMGQGLLSCLSSTKRYVGKQEIRGGGGGGGGGGGVRVNCLLFLYLMRVGMWLQVEIVNIKDRERNGGNREKDVIL